MKTINCEFKPIEKVNLDQIKRALHSTRQLRESTSLQIKRVRKKTLLRYTAQREKLRTEHILMQQQQEIAWQYQREREHQLLQTDLINHIQNKCQEIIKRILVELVDEVPELALDWGYKKLSLLLLQLGRTHGISVTATAEILSYPAITELCASEGIKAVAAQSQERGSLILTLPNGKILSSIEQDLHQLMRQWSTGVELVKELHAFVGQSE
jgi:hypothetical protein